MCQSNILYVEHFQQPPERTASEFASLVMYTTSTYWMGIKAKPALHELILNALGSHLMISSTKLKALSMHGKALSSTFLQLTLTSQGPIRSMTTSSKVQHEHLF